MNPRLRAILVDDARRALDHRQQAQAAASGEPGNNAPGAVVVSEYLKRSLRHRPWLVHRKTKR